MSAKLMQLELLWPLTLIVLGMDTSPPDPVYPVMVIVPLVAV